MSSRRVTYIALALSTIVIGLLVHVGGAALGRAARDIVGDALWAAMMAWWMGALMPRAKGPVCWAAAYGICVAVELSQVLHAPWLDAIRATRLGHLVLGNGFDPRDLLAYAAGVAAAAFVDQLVIRRRPIRETPGHHASSS